MDTLTPEKRILLARSTPTLSATPTPLAPLPAVAPPATATAAGNYLGVLASELRREENRHHTVRHAMVAATAQRHLEDNHRQQHQFCQQLAALEAEARDSERAATAAAAGGRSKAQVAARYAAALMTPTSTDTLEPRAHPARFHPFRGYDKTDQEPEPFHADTTDGCINLGHSGRPSISTSVPLLRSTSYYDIKCSHEE